MKTTNKQVFVQNLGIQLALDKTPTYIDHEKLPPKRVPIRPSPSIIANRYKKSTDPARCLDRLCRSCYYTQL